MSYFNEDPWEKCSLGSYPAGVRFSEYDARFRVSKDSAGSVILFIHEDEKLLVSDLLKDIFSGLQLYQDTAIPGTRMVIKLEAIELKNKFAIVCRSIVDEAGSLTGVALYNFIYEELFGWSSFMRPKKSGLSDEEYTGLWGELSVALDHYLRIFGVKKFCDTWTGLASTSTPQDLSGCDFTIEVKATFVVTPKVLNISSLEQLDAPVQKQALLHLRLSESSDGRSLQDLIQSIEAFMAGHPRELSKFLRVVREKVGDASEEQLRQKNSILGSDCWEISTDFPRLRRSEISPLITKAEYKISIHGLSDFKCEDGIEGFLNGV
jgi:hypothetical protein